MNCEAPPRVHRGLECFPWITLQGTTFDEIYWRESQNWRPAEKGILTCVASYDESYAYVSGLVQKEIAGFAKVVIVFRFPVANDSELGLFGTEPNQCCCIGSVFFEGS